MPSGLQVSNGNHTSWAAVQTSAALSSYKQTWKENFLFRKTFSL